ncbi:succinate dehydrogenase, hydrophobic membrane anchor protein [Curtobacterium flaccumfaciens pv. betae]|uniref:succinate dehydrogenase, hydrophobic membrane anchor protein n=1 Tax=Curtobacterium flaccumfaciens TaxID=2035 RepID=UPI00265A557F|nr:succinate dehydrogenase, hydrophobic membrane anchor protein [Curtobacterium flaccumfaciens]MCS5512580.1 succinate dehydrogenase, hydrophobic membrane anchor protein [Curtobacterium flaccumfaciens pv. betae]
MTTQIVEPPRSAAAARSTTNWEKWAWIYMRASGVLLVVLIFGHLFVNMVAGEGVKQIDFAFVAGKWANPFWQVWDSLMLVLALIHGSNGMRTIVNDYVSKPGIRKTLLVAILAACVVLIVLGLLVCWTFDPCPAGAAAADLPSFCPAQ